MRKKILRLQLVIAVSAIICLSLPGFTDGAATPTVTNLGYYTLSGSAPARIAIDNTGKFYATDANTDAVYVYSNNGVFLTTVKITNPLSIAVDSNGKVFIGSAYDGSVAVYNIQGEFQYKLGSGEREFIMPNDIAISSSGTVYVTDSMQNVIKAYTTSGSYLFSFSSGETNFPTGITVDDAAGEVYVSDHASNMIKIFDLNGVYKRYIKGSGMMGSKFVMPQGLAIDSTRVYIADAFNSVIVVYGKDGTFLNYIGNYGELAGEFKTPLDIAIDKDNKLFITNYNNSRIEVIGIDSFTAINANPSAISLTLFDNSEPVTQSVSLTHSGEAAGWTASTTDSWVSVTPIAGITPSAVDITINPTGLSTGSHTAQAIFSTTTGTSAIVLVNLEIKNQQTKTISAAPTSINLKYQQESEEYPTANIAITSTGGSVTWTATTDKEWITLSNTQGETPSNITININDKASKLNPDTYTANLTINAGEAGSAVVKITLRVINAGTIKVKTNIEEAAFDITSEDGGVTYSGTGREWSNDEVPPGQYTINFKHIKGYIKPPTQTFTVNTGKETEIEGIYRTKPKSTHIIAGSGATKGKKVTILKLDGTTEITFEPFEAPEGIRVATGDLEGNGIDRIILTDHKRQIKIYTHEGKELASYQMPEWYKNTVITVADINNDGKAEIITGSENDRHSEKDKTRIIKQLNYEQGTIVEKDTLYTEDKEGEYNITSGDIDGDGIVELIIADKETIKAFDIDLKAENKLTEKWAINKQYKETPEIAAGEIIEGEDGKAEIALSIEQEKETDKGKKENTRQIKILKGTGEESEITIQEPYGDLGYEKPATVTLGDTDSDAVDEIVTGAGKDEHNEALIRIYESNGEYTNTEINANMAGKFGVNVGVGRFE